MLRKLNKKQLLYWKCFYYLLKSYRNNSMATIIVSLRYCAPGGLHPPSPSERNHTKPFFEFLFVYTVFIRTHFFLLVIIQEILLHAIFPFCCCKKFFNRKFSAEIRSGSFSIVVEAIDFATSNIALS